MKFTLQVLIASLIIFIPLIAFITAILPSEASLDHSHIYAPCLIQRGITGTGPTVENNWTFQNNATPPPIYAGKTETDVVMFVPSPVDWEERRCAVYTQFEREGWARDKASLLFIIGNASGAGLKDTVDTSKIVKYPLALNVIVNCRDYGDEFDNPDDTSGTTCKVYEALKYIAANYNAKYVWRGADDSYVNLRYFFSDVMPNIPATRLYLGSLRRTDTVQHDLLLSRQPNLQKLFGIYQFGQYMFGMGFLLSFDVVDFVASLKIPPHLTWCEDLMVGMWLLPFQITFMDYPGFHEQNMYGKAKPGKQYLLVHRMTPDQWNRIGDDGTLH
jgi:hypothetical protein